METTGSGEDTGGVRAEVVPGGVSGGRIARIRVAGWPEDRKLHANILECYLAFASAVGCGITTLEVQDDGKWAIRWRVRIRNRDYGCIRAFTALDASAELGTLLGEDAKNDAHEMAKETAR